MRRAYARLERRHAPFAPEAEACGYGIGAPPRRPRRARRWCRALVLALSAKGAPYRPHRGHMRMRADGAGQRCSSGSGAASAAAAARRCRNTVGERRCHVPRVRLPRSCGAARQGVGWRPPPSRIGAIDANNGVGGLGAARYAGCVTFTRITVQPEMGAFLASVVYGSRSRPWSACLRTGWPRPRSWTRTRI